MLEWSWAEACYTRQWCSVSALGNKSLSHTETSTYLAQRTQFMCWLSENRNFCLWTVHTLIVLSSEAVTKDWPSLEKWTLLTVPVWALKTVDSPLLYRRKKKTLKLHNRTAKILHTWKRKVLYAKQCYQPPFLWELHVLRVRKKLINPKLMLHELYRIHS